MPRTSGLASGVAQQHLERRPGRPERRPREHGHDRPRQGRLHEHERRPGDLLVADDRDRVDERDPVVAEQRPHEHEGDEQQEQDTDDEGAAAARAPPGGGKVPGDRVGCRGAGCRDGRRGCRDGIRG
jgi:hypothetical protein